jgi:hypothetical protein
MNIIQTIDVFAGGPGSGCHGDNCGRPSLGHKIEPGDKVKLKAPITVWNQKTGNNDTYHPGKVATVVNVLPKVFDADQMVSVQVHKNHDPEYTKMDNIELHKPGNADQVEEIKPVRAGKIIIKFETSDGAQVTWVKPQDAPQHDIKSIMQMAEDKHSLKGQFALIDSMKGVQDRPGFARVTKLYDTSGMPSHLQQGKAATLYVNTYSRGGGIRQIVVQEQNTTTFSQKSKGMLEFDYKNAAAAVGMLKERYGIKTSLSRLSKGKF